MNLIFCFVCIKFRIVCINSCFWLYFNCIHTRMYVYLTVMQFYFCLDIFGLYIPGCAAKKTIYNIITHSSKNCTPSFPSLFFFILFSYIYINTYVLFMTPKREKLKQQMYVVMVIGMCPPTPVRTPACLVWMNSNFQLFVWIMLFPPHLIDIWTCVSCWLPHITSYSYSRSFSSFSWIDFLH